MSGITGEIILSICIPTYNRGNGLDFILKDLTDKIINLPVEIIICDNNSGDDTKEIVNKYILNDKVSFYSQTENVGFDLNLLTSINKSRGKYCWLLGDASIINYNRLLSILQILKNITPMAYIMNISKRVRGHDKSVCYLNANQLLLDLGWHCTQMPAIIIEKKQLEIIDQKRFLNTNFVHFGILFECISKYEIIKVYWDAENSLDKLPDNIKKISSWYPQRAWEIFMKDWCEIVLSLPSSYKLDNKLICIKSHNIRTGIFYLKSVFLQRIARAYSWSIYKRYKSYLSYTNSSWWYKLELIILAIVPVVCCQKIYNFFLRIKI